MPRLLTVGLIVLIAVVTAALGYQLLKSPTSSSAAASPYSPSSPPPSAPAPANSVRNDDSGTPDEADGVVPDGVTVFDDTVPGVANLDPDLLKALREAATDAADDGVKFYVNSGWRSPEYQNQLLREAVAKYGSEKEAARWVATPEKSLHVSGDAVDIGKTNAATWLSKHGAAYKLCQIYRNEPWHFELRPEATTKGCPRMYADPTQDPRLQP
ncbi:MAG: M15 family metallopeptidase [Streptomycetaceae bacterium]|nr:M15 family metallopeptidase [Streptomycetaceae bacterium]